MQEKLQIQLISSSSDTSPVTSQRWEPGGEAVQQAVVFVGFLTHIRAIKISNVH